MAQTTMNIYDSSTGRVYSLEEQSPSRVVSDANFKSVISALQSAGLLSSNQSHLQISLSNGFLPWTPPA